MAHLSEQTTGERLRAGRQLRSRGGHSLRSFRAICCSLLVVSDKGCSITGRPSMTIPQHDGRGTVRIYIGHDMNGSEADQPLIVCPHYDGRK
jgi:hypothetical protein